MAAACRVFGDYSATEFRRGISQIVPQNLEKFAAEKRGPARIAVDLLTYLTV